MGNYPQFGGNYPQVKNNWLRDGLLLQLQVVAWEENDKRASNQTCRHSSFLQFMLRMKASVPPALSLSNAMSISESPSAFDS